MENKLFSSKVSKIVLHKGEEKVIIDWFDSSSISIIEDSDYEKVIIKFSSGVESTEFNRIDPLYITKVEVYKDVRWYKDNTEGVVVDTYIGCKSIRKELYGVGNYRYELIFGLSGAERSVDETKTKEDIISKLDLKTQRILNYLEDMKGFNIELGKDVNNTINGLIKNDAFADVLRNIQKINSDIWEIDGKMKKVINIIGIN